MTNEEMNKIIRDWLSPSKSSIEEDNQMIAMSNLFTEWKNHPVTKFVDWYIGEYIKYQTEEALRHVNHGQPNLAATHTGQVYACRFIKSLSWNGICSCYYEFDKKLGMKAYLKEMENEKM